MHVPFFNFPDERGAVDGRQRSFFTRSGRHSELRLQRIQNLARDGLHVIPDVIPLVCLSISRRAAKRWTPERSRLRGNNQFGSLLLQQIAVRQLAVQIAIMRNVAIKLQALVEK